MLLYLVRHAPAIDRSRLAGRRDVPADCSDTAAFEAFRAGLPTGTALWSSPAHRCRMTVSALGLGMPDMHNDLWEQDFGAWEGLPFQQLPDLGPMSMNTLARHRPPGGESFDMMTSRVRARLHQIRGDTIVVAHAGTVRAALTMVVGSAALSFAVDTLSLTVMRREAGEWSVVTVNWTPRLAVPKT